MSINGLNEGYIGLVCDKCNTLIVQWPTATEMPEGFKELFVDYPIEGSTDVKTICLPLCSGIL